MGRGVEVHNSNFFFQLFDNSFFSTLDVFLTNIHHDVTKTENNQNDVFVMLNNYFPMYSDDF